MSTQVFIAVIVAIGIVYLVYFRRMKDRAEKRRRGGEKNPVGWWLKRGFDDKDDDQ